MSGKNSEFEYVGGTFVVIFTLVMFLGCLHSCFGPKSPPPKPIEQIRAERNERYNEAGKSLHELGRGIFGLDKSKKPEPGLPLQKNLDKPLEPNNAPKK